MKDYIVYVQDGDDENARWFFTCEAEDAQHAEDQALDHDASVCVIAIYERAA